MKQLLLLLTCVVAFAHEGTSQTNVFSAVMANNSGQIHKPTNFWAANASAVNSIVTNQTTINLSQLFATTRFATTFAGVATSLSGMSIGNEPGWFEMFSPGSNSVASGQAMLMRYVLSGQATGAGLQFGTRNYALVVDLATSTEATNNIVRCAIGNTFVDAGTLTGSGIGFEIRTDGGTNQIRVIAKNGTNALASSGWIGIGGPNRTVVSVESRTNGQVSLSTSQGITGELPTVRTNISGGPTSPIGSGTSHVNLGLFITTTNALTRYVAVYGAGVQIVP
jgi:hypothetical protein